MDFTPLLALDKLKVMPLEEIKLTKDKWNRPITYSPDTKGALQAIEDLRYEMHNPYNDGFTGSIMKRRLVQIKETVEKALVDAPTYSDE